MNIAAVIAEYNPFHNGHLYQLEQIKEQTGADYIIVLMSGSFTQRGEAAMLHKYARTQMALSHGANMVVELPVYYACGSADYFARGAIAHLNHMGCITHLCFGCENAKLEQLMALARLLAKEPAEFQASLSHHLKMGLNFPKARALALADLNLPEFESKESLLEFLSGSNNILAIEYIKALILSNSSIKPVAIQRQGANYHDQDLDLSLCSASAIRGYLAHQEDTTQLYHTLPKTSYDLIHTHRSMAPPICNDDFSQALGLRLLQGQGQFDTYLDINTDLSNKLSNHLEDYMSFSQFNHLIAGKDYTLTRISRVLCHLMLGLTKADMDRFTEEGLCFYLRALGFRKTDAPLLKELTSQCDRPFVTKLTTDMDTLSDSGKMMLSKELFASNLYTQVFSAKFKKPLKNDYRQGLILY